MDLLRRPPGFIFKTYAHQIILAGCWFVVQTILFLQYGIETSHEARKYIEQADNLLATGSVSSPNFWLYSVEIFLIALVKKIHAGYIWVIGFHWFFNLLATYYLYNFSRRVANRTTGLIIALLFVFAIPLQTHNSFLQTESLFFSFTILLSCYLWQMDKLNWKNLGFIIFFLLIIAVTRPTGLFWFASTFLYLFFRFFRKYGIVLKITTVAITGGFFLLLLNMAMGSGGELDFMRPYRNEMIVCGVPTIDHYAPVEVSGNPNSLWGLFYYVTHNFDQFSRLAWLRTRAFWGLCRSYYSTGHNLYLSVYFYPFYALALWSLRDWFGKFRSLFLYCASLIALVWGTAMLTCDDWHNRFFLSIAPYIYVLAIPAIHAITRQNKSDAAQ